MVKIDQSEKIVTPVNIEQRRRPADRRKTTLQTGPLELDMSLRTANRGDRVIRTQVKIGLPFASPAGSGRALAAVMPREDADFT